MQQIAEIIKYEGDNSTFIWKHPCEDFNSLTQLIVHESQEAIFFMNGQALDLFGAGRYTLQTQNIPKLGKILNRTTDDKTPFHCEVYFINKTEQMSIKWGTDSKVQYIEPTYGFPLSIGASGEMSLRASDSRKLLLKLVGTEDFLNQQKLVGYFRAFLMTKVKTYIAQMMKENAINIFEIDEQLSEFSESIKKLLIPDFADYGVSLERFFVTTIVKPDGDRQYEKFKELHFRQYADIAEAKLRQQTDLIYAQTEAQKVVIDSQAQAAKRAQEGYTYQQERGFDVASEIAHNEAIGQFTNMGVGLGTMAGVGGAIGGMVGNAVGGAINSIDNVQPQDASQLQNVLQPQDAASQEMQLQGVPAQGMAAQVIMADAFCENCGAKLMPGSAFCEECGAAVPKDNTKCANCGYVFERPGKFCPKCGAKRG